MGEKVFVSRGSNDGWGWGLGEGSRVLMRMNDQEGKNVQREQASEKNEEEREESLEGGSFISPIH